MILIAKLDTAKGYLVACKRLEEGERRWLSPATHRVALIGPAGVVRRYDIPAGSDACAAARARNIADMGRSGLLDPAPRWKRKRRWIASGPRS